MKRIPLAKLALLVVLLFAAMTVSQATFSIFINDEDLVFKGASTWNTATSATVKVRVLERDNGSANVRVIVRARATDGSTVGGQVFSQIRAQQIREFSITLSKPITSLVFIQILENPAND